MVSAVFHSPLSVDAESRAIKSAAGQAIDTRATGLKHSESTAMTTQSASPATPSAFDWRGVLMAVLPPLMGLGLLIGLWALVSITTKGSIPSPYETGLQAIEIFSDPFYRKGPNDQGVGWNVLMSLERVAVGFGLAAAVGIPAGFAIGRFEFLSRMFNPLISLLRPVSPLAWLPRLNRLCSSGVGSKHLVVKPPGDGVAVFAQHRHAAPGSSQGLPDDVRQGGEALPDQDRDAGERRRARGG